MTARPIVIALGGNAIKQSHELGTTEEQFANIDTAAEQIGRMLQNRPGVVLAKAVNAEKLIILTDVEKVCLNYNTLVQSGTVVITSPGSAAAALRGETGTRIGGKAEKAAV
jgi:carbamate kinase